MIDNPPLVSVLMPVFNAQDTVLYSLCSLLAQTYSNWECVIVNDGSNDATLKNLTVINDERIRVYSFPYNKGRGAARKKTLELARGEYITMLDADDWLYPEKIALQVDYLEKNKDVSLHTMGMALANKGELVGVRSGGDLCKDYSDFHRLNVPHAPSMLRRSAIGDEDYDERFLLAQDQDFIRRVLAGRKYFSTSSLAYVYEEAQSVSVKKAVRAYFFSSRSYAKLYKKFGFKVYILSFSELLKVPFFCIMCFLRGRESVLAARSVEPSSDQQREYKKAKKVIDQLYLKFL